MVSINQYVTKMTADGQHKQSWQWKGGLGRASELLNNLKMYWCLHKAHLIVYNGHTVQCQVRRYRGRCME